ncbi:RNHCP domain-containing protein [Chloroflexia bacterium SDU3-3]|nr:RNHCP domain-containing protein [Chloroflexia bacterium SDU3-3]
MSSPRPGQHWTAEPLFTCVGCGLPVVCDPLASGVQNRNHCPACLTSRHMDWRTAGDRLSSCRAAMEPVGLTTKRSRNKYARERDGELMLIHRCSGCGKLVINRIAADDSADALLELFARSQQAPPELLALLRDEDLAMLTPDDEDLVRERLFGSAMAR